MQLERQTGATTWVVAGPDHALARLQPLIAAHQSQRPVRVLESGDLTISDLQDAACLLVVGKARRWPGISVSGVFLETDKEHQIVIGRLPDVDDRLEAYADAAAKVQLRRNAAPARGPFILLGELEERTLDAVERVTAQMPKDSPIFQWTAERLRRQDLISALRCGPGAAFYFGHATASGWAGYGGFDKTDVALVAGNPLGAILSLTCSSATRPPKALSFCEEMVLSGLCCAALGASRKTLHQQNVRLGMALAQALASGRIINLADLLLAARVPRHILARYRVVGDPFAPLIGHAEAHVQARAVFAPAPDDPLPVIPLSAW
jgi:Peptidase family C25